MTEHDAHDQGSGIGSPLRRKETERFIQGAGTYADDVQLANQAYAAFVRSFHAHAEIKCIDAEGAKAMPGVLGVFSEGDWAGLLNESARRAQSGHHDRQAEGGREGTPRSGNLRRCTGYVNIVQAVRSAAMVMSEKQWHGGPREAVGGIISTGDHGTS